MPLCQEANETETNIYEVKAATEVHQSDKGINYEDHLSWLPRSPHPPTLSIQWRFCKSSHSNNQKEVSLQNAKWIKHNSNRKFMFTVQKCCIDEQTPIKIENTLWASWQMTKKRSCWHFQAQKVVVLLQGSERSKPSYQLACNTKREFQSVKDLSPRWSTFPGRLTIRIFKRYTNYNIGGCSCNLACCAQMQLRPLRTFFISIDQQRSKTQKRFQRQILLFSLILFL